MRRKKKKLQRGVRGRKGRGELGGRGNQSLDRRPGEHKKLKNNTLGTEL